MTPPSHDAVMQGMKKLEEIIKDEHEKSGLVRKGRDEILAKLRAPLAKIVGDNKDLVQKRINEVKNRPKPAKSTPIKIVPQSNPEVFSLLRTAPYDFQWTSTGGDAQTNASANEKNGTISVGVGAENENGYASAGVGVLVSPPSDMSLYFRPLLLYNYSWLDLADFVNAHSSAFFGIYIQQFDSTGKNVDNTDLRYPLWNDDAGWLDEHSGNGNNTTVNATPTISVSSGYNYIFWTWFSVSCWNGFGTFSDGSIEAQVNTMSFFSVG